MAISAKTTLTAVLAVLALAAAASAADLVPEILKQPRNVQRGQVVRIAWTGEASNVAVEHRHGLFWLTDTSEVVVEEEGDGVFSARWQPTYFTPSGLYRIRVDGLTSEEFRVRPCWCVLPNQVRSRWRKGRFRLSLTAAYAPPPPGGLRTLAKRVTTGRPVIRVMRDGRRIGTVRLRYKRDKFRGSWRAPRGPRHSLVFELVSLTDRFKHR